MAKTIKFIIIPAICFVMFMLFNSCSDTQSPVVETTEISTTEKAPETSGIYSGSICWRYDESTSTMFLYGTGKATGTNTGDDISNWMYLAENICIEEGITETKDTSFIFYDNIKTLTLPASYVGDLPVINKIEKYTIAENNPKFSSDEYGVLFNQDKTTLIAFPKYSPVENYEIPEGVTNISSDAFKGSKNLKTVTIPESLKGISSTIFKESSVYLNPQNWENDVFYAGDCLVEVDWETKAESIIVKEGTRKIEAYAFALCKNVKSITIPDSVEIIGAQAFVSCSSLENIYIGSGVKEIGIAPFVFETEGSPCIKLKNIEVSKENQNFVSVDGVLFTKDMTKLIQYPIGKKQKEYVIPDSVTSVGWGAFCYCDELIKLTVGKGVIVIDDCLIFGCDNMETIILPDTLTKLEGGAFKHSGIRHIDIPDSVTYLGCEAMTGCLRLETVNIGKGVSFIHEWAISGSSLKRINVDPLNPHFSSVDGVLYNKDKTELLRYPADKSGEVYRIPDSVKTIKLGAIMQAKNLQKIYVGSGVQQIEECNFYENVEDPELDYRNETNYTIYYNGTEKQWNKLFENEYERDEIDKSKVNFS